MNWPAAFGIFGGFLGIVAACAALWVYVKGSYSKSTIDALQQDVNNWKNRVDERDARIEHLEEVDTRKDATIRRLGVQIEEANRSLADLREMVLQRAEFDRIVKQTEQHERAAVNRAKQRQDEHRQLIIAVETVSDKLTELISRD